MHMVYRGLRKLHSQEPQIWMAFTQKSKCLSGATGGVHYRPRISWKVPLTPPNYTIERRSALFLESGHFGTVIPIVRLIVIFRIAENRVAETTNVESKDLLGD